MSLFNHEGKTVYVAGHSGLAGSAICRALESEQCNIITASHAELDLVDQTKVDQWFCQNRPDVVYLAAATAGGIHANFQYPADFIYNNLMIQCNVIKASYKYGVSKLCFLGSSCIYPGRAQQPMTEDCLLTGPLDQHNIWYAVAKIAGLYLVDGFSRQYSCEFISVMPANLYGPGDKYSEGNSHVVAALIDRFHTAKIEGAPTVDVWGSGTAHREFMHCDDMANAVVHTMKHYSSPKILNIGTGSDISIRDLAFLIKEITNYQGKVLFDETKLDGVPRKVVSVDKLKALGWESKINLREGLIDTYNSYLETHA
jgi:GDP-L-fucose synthase